MPYDPAFPATDAFLISSEFRSQFTGIVDLIGTIPVGPQGPAGTSVNGVVIDGVTTLNPGESATGNASFVSGDIHFNFAIPRGADGTNGTNGINGEVMSADLTSAISTTAKNPGTVSTFLGIISDPPTQGEMVALANKVNELLTALTR